MKKPDAFITPILDGPRVAGLIKFNSFVKGDPEEMKRDFMRTALLPQQTHSLNVGLVKEPWDRFEDTDALVTFEEDLPIGVVTADCVPILIFSPDVRGIAAIHAGWKGTLGGIVERTLDILEEHGAKPEDMVVSFGPSISQKYYEVDKELASRFIEAGFDKYVTYGGGDGESKDSTNQEGSKPHIDLQGVNVERLLRRGVKRENIKLSKWCTFSTKDGEGEFLLPSYRRDGKEAGRFLTGIMLLAH